jgi:hypothetical protein
MLTIMLWITVGILIGWNLPQPVWAQNAQDSLVDFVTKVIRKVK